MTQVPKTLLIGKNGQLGWDILTRLERLSNVIAVDRSTLDLTRSDEIRQCIRSVRPDVIVNAAAYTAVDKAELEPELAQAINSRGPEVLGQEAARAGSLLVHYSTDYVFDGTKSDPYTEEDPICPINVYGASKASGEDAIRHTGCRHLIFRTSWVFSNRGNNFLLTMLKLARQREGVKIVNDQIGAPTSSASIAAASVDVLQQVLGAGNASQSLGTYHMTARGETSWFEFAKQIFKMASTELSIKAPQVYPIPSVEYATAARRPLNSRLNCQRLETSFGIALPHWENCLTAIMTSIVASSKDRLPSHVDKTQIV